ncbi:RNA polymerase sigma-70 factor [Rhabdobacter roseus]|uniref:RNA polymerase sigma-70 factor (ECF subfamily) n=1 Tax=Rhabdobacter roseus TaxID=1655419 RepID=A0A840U4Z1_9BACT|nr:RNA polymerase sigma-70 factor [Rhabdobacter roseus]MBB5287388.1 RNA polymerase sigma-70 factor (ECF subfamily) [Rhabdobacter roseus]
MAIYSEFSDAELMLLLSGSDGLAFAEIYQRYTGALFIHAYRILGDEEEAKDVIQELFAVLWIKRNTIVLRTSLSSYLYSSVKNRILDLIAHKKVEDRYVRSLGRFIDEGEYVTDQQVREKELSELIEREVALLPPRMREVFELSRRDNLSYKEIAEELNISDKTVKKQVNSALSILRQKLDIAFLCAFFLRFL